MRNELIPPREGAGPLIADRAEIARFFTEVMRGEVFSPDGERETVSVRDRLTAAKALAELAEKSEDPAARDTGLIVIAAGELLPEGSAFE